MEKKSKLVLAVLQGSDSDNTIRNLNERGFMVTVLSSTGGLLKKKSTTLPPVPMEVMAGGAAVFIVSLDDIRKF